MRFQIYRLSALAAVFIPLAASQARATPIVVPNFSFESQTVADGTTTLTGNSSSSTENFAAVTGWGFWSSNGSSTVSAGVVNPPSPGQYTDTAGDILPSTADALNALRLSSTGGSAGNVAKAEVTLPGMTLHIGDVITLTVAVGHATGLTFPTTNEKFFILTGTSGEVGFGGTKQATGSYTDPGAGHFADNSVSWISTLSGTQILGIQLTSGGTTAGQVDLDNVRLTTSFTAAAVPEPGSLALAATGMLALALLFRSLRPRRTARAFACRERSVN